MCRGAVIPPRPLAPHRAHTQRALQCLRLLSDHLLVGHLSLDCAVPLLDQFLLSETTLLPSLMAGTVLCLRSSLKKARSEEDVVQTLLHTSVRQLNPAEILATVRAPLEHLECACKWVCRRPLDGRDT